MSNFVPLTLEHKTLFDRYLPMEDSKNSGLSFGNVYLWDGMCHRNATRLGDRLGLEYLCPRRPYFAYPIGEGPLAPAVEALRLRSEQAGRPLLLRGITAPQRAALEEALPGKFQYTEDRDNADYIYTVESMSTLAGKKLHGKRNHCNKFEAQHPHWSSRPLTPEDFSSCLALLSQWGEDRGGGSPEELQAIETAFRDWTALGLEGLVLRDGEDILAFTVGERLTRDTIDVHFEKAQGSVQGAYPMVAREYARYVQSQHPEVRYLNREEDMGLENLRKAKMDWYPLFLVEKFNALWKAEP